MDGLIDPKTDAGILMLLERILDSPYECDKWRSEAERAYKARGGTKLSLLAPTLRERIAARGTGN